MCFAAGMHMLSEQQLIKKKSLSAKRARTINTIAKVISSAH